MADKVHTFLWFDGTAEEAAEFYTDLFPDSRIQEVTRTPMDYPGGRAGDVVTVAFTLSGRNFTAMNGGRVILSPTPFPCPSTASIKPKSIATGMPFRMAESPFNAAGSGTVSDCTGR